MGWFLPFLGGLASTVLGINQQGKENRKLAEFQANANERYLDKQLEYNTPANQMKRFQEAGLNPNLVYGQGNPGNQSAPLTYPEIKPRDFAQLSQQLPLFNQTMLTQSQVSATNAQTVLRTAQAGVAKVQEEVLKANPALDTEGFKAIISNLVSGAQIKAAEANIATGKSNFLTKPFMRDTGDSYYKGTRLELQMEYELETLFKRFNILGQDSAIKAEVISQKEFQNAILELQQKFMRMEDISPENLLRFAQMILMFAK